MPLFAEVIKTGILSFLAVPVVVFGKQRMVAATGKIFLINISAVLLDQWPLQPLMKILCMPAKAKIPCAAM